MKATLASVKIDNKMLQTTYNFEDQGTFSLYTVTMKFIGKGQKPVENAQTAADAIAQYIESYRCERIKYIWREGDWNGATILPMKDEAVPEVLDHLEKLDKGIRAVTAYTLISVVWQCVRPVYRIAHSLGSNSP